VAPSNQGGVTQVSTRSSGIRHLAFVFEMVEVFAEKQTTDTTPEFLSSAQVPSGAPYYSPIGGISRAHQLLNR
jgi:hypothetical protein